MENTTKKSNAPTHNVAVGESRQIDRKIVTYWTKVGVAWEHDEGKLFVRLREGISISGQFGIFPVKEKIDTEAPVETETPPQG
jgi:hypothetical protein